MPCIVITGCVLDGSTWIGRHQLSCNCIRRVFCQDGKRSNYLGQGKPNETQPRAQQHQHQAHHRGNRIRTKHKHGSSSSIKHSSSVKHSTVAVAPA